MNTDCMLSPDQWIALWLLAKTDYFARNGEIRKSISSILGRPDYRTASSTLEFKPGYEALTDLETLGLVQSFRSEFEGHQLDYTLITSRGVHVSDFYEAIQHRNNREVYHG